VRLVAAKAKAKGKSKNAGVKSLSRGIAYVEFEGEEGVFAATQLAGGVMAGFDTKEGEEPRCSSSSSRRMSSSSITIHSASRTRLLTNH
jgi:hypothetical protein